MSEFTNTIDIVGDDVLADSIIARSVTEFHDNVVQKIGTGAFANCDLLTSVDCPTATSVSGSAFAYCDVLIDANLPLVTTIGVQVFDNCPALTKITLPSVTSIGSQAFRACTALNTVELNSKTSIGEHALLNASVLKVLVLRSTAGVSTLSSTNAFNGTPIESGTGYIYIPSSLLNSYKTASNWSTYADQFRKLEEWTVDGTVTGDLDIDNRCMVRFFNDDGTLLGYKVVAKGSDVAYDGDTPVCSDDPTWLFSGFMPEPTNVTADMDCYATYADPTPSFDETDFSLGYGVEWDYTNSSPTLTRIGLASEFSNPSIPTSASGTGSSPFDNVLPWSGMKRYNIIDNEVVYSEDDEGFSMTNYDTMVYIPPFYYAAYQDEATSKWRWSISPTKKEGYALHPGSGRYVGRFHTSGDSTAVYSKGNQGALANTTASSFRSYSHKKGAKWWAIDVATWSAIQLLYLIEFADFNSQSKLGQGYLYGPADSISYGTFGYHTYNGGVMSNQYRWIWAPFGHRSLFLEGLMVQSNQVYVGTNNSEFTFYVSSLKNAEITLRKTGGYATSLRYSTKFPWVFIPDDAEGGSKTTYTTDGVYTNSNSNVCVPIVGNTANSSEAKGLFYLDVCSNQATSRGDWGSRLIFIP